MGAPAALRGGQRGEQRTPLLLLCALCWLCCWPDGASEDASPGGAPGGARARSPPSADGHRNAPPGGGGGGGGGGAPRGPLGARRLASAAELQLPGTSGHGKTPLSAHRSHEEIPGRRRSALEAQARQEARYHSAPSVIREVLLRRDWDRSARELHIPLKPPRAAHDDSDASSPEAPCAEPESSPEAFRSEERLHCKKHHTNIKSSRNRVDKESNRDDIKDTDATESSLSNFYIGDVTEPARDIDNDVALEEQRLLQEKRAKQSINESIRTQERPPAAADGAGALERCHRALLHAVAGAPARSPDRSGARRGGARASACSASSASSALPPPSVEAAGYECAACYLREAPRRGVPCACRRARHASDGDVLARARRPESGAFSESDLELELALRSSDERPPSYHEVEPPYREVEPPYREGEPPYREVEPPYREGEPPYREVEPPYREIEPRYREVEPPYREVEPPYREGEPPYREVEPPYREIEPRYREVEPPHHGLGSAAPRRRAPRETAI